MAGAGKGVDLMARAKKSDPAPFIEEEPAEKQIATLSNVTGLANYLDRVEHVEEEIAALNSDKKEIWAELKAEGFDVAMARKAHSLRKLNRKKRLTLGQYVDSLSLFE
jgi:uncharacterized protein (UPF0335 family)